MLASSLPHWVIGGWSCHHFLKSFSNASCNHVPGMIRESFLLISSYPTLVVVSPEGVNFHPLLVTCVCVCLHAHVHVCTHACVRVRVQRGRPWESHSMELEKPHSRKQKTFSWGEMKHCHSYVNWSQRELFPPATCIITGEAGKEWERRWGPRFVW